MLERANRHGEKAIYGRQFAQNDIGNVCRTYRVGDSEAMHFSLKRAVTNDRRGHFIHLGVSLPVRLSWVMGNLRGQAQPRIISMNTIRVSSHLRIHDR
jgi:hypothetical protein